MVYYNTEIKRQRDREGKGESERGVERCTHQGSGGEERGKWAEPFLKKRLFTEGSTKGWDQNINTHSFSKLFLPVMWLHIYHI